MRYSLVFKSVALVGALSICSTCISAPIELSIGAISVDASGGSFVVSATAPEPTEIGAYDIGLMFQDYNSIESLTYDATNLAASMSELGELFGTTPHPADLSDASLVRFASFGFQTVTPEPIQLMRVDFTVPDSFSVDDSYSVLLFEPEIGSEPAIFARTPTIITGLPDIPACDLNLDGICNAGDIDLLSAEIRGGSPDVQRFDLNNDSVVDNSDRLVWIGDLMNTFVGDADLDGEFDSGDFVQVFTSNQYEDDIAGNSTWATGDWNGDADFDSGDFVAAFTEGGYEKGPKPAALVPESHSSAALLVCISLLFRVMISRRR